MISSNTTVQPTTPTPASAVVTAAAQSSSDDDSDFFHNLLEIVNPLQHLPIVSTIYRNLTGDKINTLDKLAGDALYGGAIGFASSVADTVFQGITGKDFGDTVYGFLTGKGDDAVATASNPNAPMKVAAYSKLPPVDLSALDFSSVADEQSTASAIDPSAPMKIAAYTKLSPPDLSSIDVSDVAATQGNEIASAAPRQLGAKAAVATPELASLEAAMLKAQIDPVMASRAAFAYQRAVELSPESANDGINPPLN